MAQILSTRPDLLPLNVRNEFEKLQDTTKSKCKIVMLTSSINPQDVNKSKEYTYVKKYINKPLSQENLEKLEL